jgi:hypothetical protein
MDAEGVILFIISGASDNYRGREIENLGFPSRSRSLSGKQCFLREVERDHLPGKFKEGFYRKVPEGFVKTQSFLGLGQKNGLHHFLIFS